MKVEMIRFDELTNEEKEGVPNNGCGKEAANYLRVSHKGNFIGIYSDAMEPEDVKFYRDLHWIKPLLYVAYQLGLDQASTSQEK